jgi:PAS domain S-box-containing protein
MHIDVSVLNLCLLAFIALYVSGFNKLVKKLIKGAATENYINVHVKVRAFNSAPFGIITINALGRIVAWNQGAVELLGWDEREAVGHPLIMIVPIRLRDAHLKGLKNTITGSQPFIPKSIHTSSLTKEGKELSTRVTMWKWMDGKDAYYTSILENITEQQNQTLATKALLDMYDRAEDITDTGCWSWDVLNDIVQVSKGFERIFDIERAEVPSNYLLKRIYHEDLKQTEDAIKQAFVDKKGYTVIYRIVSRDGSLRKVIAHAETYLDQKGELVNITGTIQKIHGDI